MDGTGFDTLTRTLSGLRSRRGLAQVLLGVALGGTPALRDLDPADAKRGKGRKRRKQREQHRERTRDAGDAASIHADKKKKKKPCPPCKKRKQGKCKGTLPDGAACPGGSCRAGSCIPTTTPRPDCTPNCTGKACGDDGCGTSCGGCTGGLTCQGGQCVLTCDSGLTPCAGNCVNLQTDSTNCGACGTTCTFPHASATCDDGVCTLGACDAGFADCDGDPDTGCEQDVRGDPAHCGACEHACEAPPHGSATCANSTCGFTCDPDFHACGESCVSNDDSAHCGASCTPCPTSICSPATCDGTTCGRAPIASCCEQDSDCGDSDACTTDTCGPDHICQHSAVVCTSGDPCQDPVCDPGSGCATVDHCAADQVCIAAGGQAICCPETRPLWDGVQCGECTQDDLSRCAEPPPNATVTCSTQGTCRVVCLPGWGTCGHDAATCSTNLQADADHCGGCWQACASGQVCLDGVCGLVCGSDFCAVTSDTPDCCGTQCTNTQTDSANCGACGQTCANNEPCGSATCCTGLQPTDNLQAAIAAAAPGATVRLCAGTWHLAQTIVIDKDLTLIGAGPGQTILDGGHAVRVLTVTAPTAEPHVIVRGLTITNGKTASQGGGILNNAFLVLRNVDVSNNAATNTTTPLSSSGGGIWNRMSLTLVQTSVTGNSADRAGGGIVSSSNAVLLQLTLEAGSRVEGNTAVFGGGISSSGALTLKAGSHVQGNTAQEPVPNSAYPGWGGGIYNTGTLTLSTGSNVSGNTAGGGGGGGIYNASSSLPSLASADIVTDNHLTDGITVSNCAPVNTIPNCIG